MINIRWEVSSQNREKGEECVNGKGQEKQETWERKWENKTTTLSKTKQVHCVAECLCHIWRTSY